MFPALCLSVRAASGILYLTTEQFTPLIYLVPEVNTRGHIRDRQGAIHSRETVTNSVCHTQAERNLRGWSAARKINTHTLSNGLIWSLAPSVSDSHIQSDNTMV